MLYDQLIGFEGSYLILLGAALELTMCDGQSFNRLAHSDLYAFFQPQNMNIINQASSTKAAYVCLPHKQGH